VSAATAIELRVSDLMQPTVGRIAAGWRLLVDRETAELAAARLVDELASADGMPEVLVAARLLDELARAGGPWSRLDQQTRDCMALCAARAWLRELARRSS
jgi:hypothetical protein